MIVWGDWKRRLDTHPSVLPSFHSHIKIDINLWKCCHLTRLNSTTRFCTSIRPYIVKVHRRRDNLYIFERELRALCQDFAVLGDECAPIKIEPTPIAPLLVCIKIDTTVLFTRISDKGDARIQFPQFMVRTRSVRDDLHTRIAEMNMRTHRYKQFLTRLRCQACIKGSNRCDTDRHFPLSREFTNPARQCVGFSRPPVFPCRKPPMFPIVTITR